ncbi:hypothetical protein OS493_004960 [Desmophyllum pertusum]|uniref:Uncharacterized protein n=1 Tax=Desmophyllum pertusum TaxID=174260 RepID=A0A9X0CT72_9CNID|nr:hypothetical protein OS493_004960 [Desmophyllum pertusum]
MTKRKANSITDTVVLIICLLQVPSRVSMVNFKDIDISENWERADNYCKTKNMTLARIDNGSLFNSTQARFLHPLSIKKFWTGLKYDSKRLVWSNGRKAFCNGTLKEVVNCAGLLKLLRPRCFLMTAYQGKLEPSDCNIAHRFICQREILSTVHPTFKPSSQATVHGTGDGEGLVTNYVKKIRTLNGSDPSSLQHAMNMTDILLKDRKTTDGEMNVLLATKELENFISSYAKQQLTSVNDTIIQRREEFVVVMRKIPSKSEDVVFPVDTWKSTATHAMDGNDVQIRLPASLFHKHGAYMTTILHKRIDQLLPSQTTSFTRWSISPLSKPDCVFWNFSMKSPHNGSWSKKGCRVINCTSTWTHCSCDHLTNFAVLMQVKEQKISVKHQVALKLITYIGCALSLIGESIAIVAYAVFLNLKTEDTQIRFNLVISIAVAQLVFIVGIDATQIKAVCTVVAAAIHYFFLVAFVGCSSRAWRCTLMSSKYST